MLYPVSVEGEKRSEFSVSVSKGKSSWIRLSRSTYLTAVCEESLYLKTALVCVIHLCIIWGPCGMIWCVSEV